MSREEIELSADLVIDEFGSDAVYTPKAGGSVALRAVMTYAAQEINQISGSTEASDSASIRIADVALPVVGDRLDVDGRSWTVDDYIQSGAIWALTLLAVRVVLIPGPFQLEDDSGSFMLEDGSGPIMTEDS